MAYLVRRQISFFRREWLVQETPELWGERNYALIYCKEGDAKHVGRRIKKVIFVENTQAPHFNWPALRFSRTGSAEAGRKRVSHHCSVAHAF
jgi:hypothetical protein